jgi:hypothetical protein
MAGRARRLESRMGGYMRNQDCGDGRLRAAVAVPEAAAPSANAAHAPLGDYPLDPL